MGVDAQDDFPLENVRENLTACTRHHCQLDSQITLRLACMHESGTQALPHTYSLFTASNIFLYFQQLLVYACQLDKKMRLNCFDLVYISEPGIINAAQDVCFVARTKCRKRPAPDVASLLKQIWLVTGSGGGYVLRCQ